MNLKCVPIATDALPDVKLIAPCVLNSGSAARRLRLLRCLFLKPPRQVPQTIAKKVRIEHAALVTVSLSENGGFVNFACLGSQNWLQGAIQFCCLLAVTPKTPSASGAPSDSPCPPYGLGPDALETLPIQSCSSESKCRRLSKHFRESVLWSLGLARDYHQPDIITIQLLPQMCVCQFCCHMYICPGFYKPLPLDRKLLHN